MNEQLTGETVELLQALIRNQCVNDGSIDSGDEFRNAELLRDFLEGNGLEFETFEPTPGRTSLVARYPGTDPDAPSLCLMGHTDVVPVSPDGWSNDPFGGELIGDEVWGRGAVDMLNLTSSMAVAFRHLVRTGQRSKGDLIYFAVADEEAGGIHGAEVLLDRHWDVLGADYVLTEFGGIPVNGPEGAALMLTTGEKGVAWRRLKVRGTPGHGSRPYGTDNALVTASEVVRRLADYKPAAQIGHLWRQMVSVMDLDEEVRDALTDTEKLDWAIGQLTPMVAAHAHACTHTTFSPNVIHGGVKTNVIPDAVEIDLDVRALPGETHDDVQAHLRAALGDLADRVEVDVIAETAATESTTESPLWQTLAKAVSAAPGGSRIIPSLVTGGTDSRFYRNKGAVAYGAGLLSPSVPIEEFNRRFHGHDERIDIESLALTTQLWLDVVADLWN